MNIIIGSDHAGYQLKEQLTHYLSLLNCKIHDIGVFSETPADYPEIAKLLCSILLENNSLINHNDEQAFLPQIRTFGILICGTGIGMSITANRFVGIRAALCTNLEMAKKARQHTDSNVLVLGGRITTLAQAKKLVRAFISAEFEGGRHARRLAKIS